VSFDDDVDQLAALEMAAAGGGHVAERPTSLRQQRGSPTHSPRRSPQRTSHDVHVDQASRKWRAELAPEFKVLVVGDHGVGKTELIRQFTSSCAIDAMSAGQQKRLHITTLWQTSQS